MSATDAELIATYRDGRYRELTDALRAVYESGVAEGRRMGLQEAADIAESLNRGRMQGIIDHAYKTNVAAAIRAVLEPDKEKQ